MAETELIYGTGGEFRYNMDARKRVFIPARSREQLGKDLVIVRDTLDGFHHLSIYPAARWEARVNRLLAPLKTEGERDRMKFTLGLLMGTAEIDDQGRITLSKIQIDHAQIEKEVVITGAGDHATIWSEKTYAEHEAKYDPIAMLEALLNMPSE